MTQGWQDHVVERPKPRQPAMDIQWICFGCAEAVGSRMPDGHCCTMHIDTCDVCKAWVAVTEPRDFRPRPDVLYNKRNAKERR